MTRTSAYKHLPSSSMKTTTTGVFAAKIESFMPAILSRMGFKPSAPVSALQQRRITLDMNIGIAGTVITQIKGGGDWRQPASTKLTLSDENSDAIRQLNGHIDAAIAEANTLKGEVDTARGPWQAEWQTMESTKSFPTKAAPRAHLSCGDTYWSRTYNHMADI